VLGLGLVIGNNARCDGPSQWRTQTVPNTVGCIFNGTFSTNRLYRARIVSNKSFRGRGDKHTVIQTIRVTRFSTCFYTDNHLDSMFPQRSLACQSLGYWQLNQNKKITEYNHSGPSERTSETLKRKLVHDWGQMESGLVVLRHLSRKRIWFILSTTEPTMLIWLVLNKRLASALRSLPLLLFCLHEYSEKKSA